MHHRQTHLVTLIAADDLVHHRRQRVGEAARLAQRVVDAFVVHIDNRLDLQQRADCALNAPDAPALAQELERSDDECAQLMFAAFLQQRDGILHRHAVLQRFRRFQHQQPQTAGERFGVENMNFHVLKVLRKQGDHVERSGQAAADGQVQDARCALVVQGAVEVADILRQRQGCFRHFPLKQIIKLLLRDFEPVAELSLTGRYTQRNCANIILTELFIRQIAGRIRHQCNPFVSNLEHGISASFRLPLLYHSFALSSSEAILFFNSVTLYRCRENRHF